MEQHLVFISHSSKDAPVAQLICHRLEEAEIRCWIAPRDIHWEDWAAAIMDGLDRADICVNVVGKNYIESPECLKEIAEATRTCEYILPFKLDQAELTPAMRYHLAPCHWLDASTPPLEKRIDELIGRIRNLADEDAVYSNRRQLKLRERVVWPRPLFMGRDAELAVIAERLPEERVLFLQGMGGMGKSEIAKAYAKEYRSRYDTIVFLGYEGSIFDLVTGDSLMIDNLPPQDTDSESREDYYNRKLEALRKITTERTLFIIDNYDVGDDPHFADICNDNAHILVTTRVEHYGYASMKIGPIADFAKVRELFTTAYGRPLKGDDQACVDEMIRMVGSHTITVELLARQMKASRRKPADMLKLLKEGGLNTHLKERIRREDGAGDGSAFDYISRLFTMAGLTEEQEDLLMQMTMVPYTGIDISLFYDILQLDSYDDLNELIAHSWLMLDEDTDVLSMHPVVADVIRERMQPDVRKCSKYIAGLHREVGSLYFDSLEDRAAKWPYYAYIINNYFDPIPELWSEFNYMSTNAWICGRYDLSMKLGKQFYDYTVANFPEDYEKLGRAAVTLLGDYHNSGDDTQAAMYADDGVRYQLLAIREDSSQREWNDLAFAYQREGRYASLSGDYERAKTCFEESERICEEHGCPASYLGNTFLESGRMYEIMGDYEKCLENALRAQELYVECDGVDNPNSAHSLTDIGTCFIHFGRYDEAKEALDEALRLNLMFNGEFNRETFLARERLADLAAAQGGREQALEMYQQVEVEMSECFGEKNPALQAIREKIAAF